MALANRKIPEFAKDIPCVDFLLKELVVENPYQIMEFYELLRSCFLSQLFQEKIFFAQTGFILKL